MREVKLEDDVVAGLQRHATPLVDDFNSVIRKLLREVESYGIGRDLSPVQVATAPTRQSAKRERTMHVLLRAGILKSGTRLVLSERQVQGSLPVPISDKKLHCAIGANPRARQNVVWESDGLSYSLSALTEKLRDEYQIPLVGGALNGNLFWCLESNPGKTLWDLAEECGRNARSKWRVAS